MNTEEFEPVNINDLHVGDEVILEQKHFTYKYGYPMESTFLRTIVGSHMTVGGEAFHLVNEPNIEFPVFAEWGNDWIYAGNDGMTQMWRRKHGRES